MVVHWCWTFWKWRFYESTRHQSWMARSPTTKAGRTFAAVPDRCLPRPVTHREFFDNGHCAQYRGIFEREHRMIPLNVTPHRQSDRHHTGSLRFARERSRRDQLTPPDWYQRYCSRTARIALFHDISVIPLRLRPDTELSSRESVMIEARLNRTALTCDAPEIGCG